MGNSIHHNPELEAAVRYLYGTGTVSKDKDVADKTGYNKATVSSYISGRTKMSAEFSVKFEKAFNLKLSEYKKGGDKEEIKHPDALQLLSESILQIKAEMQTSRQLLIEVLATVSNRSVMDVQQMSERLLEHNLSKILHELKLGKF